jgi:hypothetical protein
VAVRAEAKAEGTSEANANTSAGTRCPLPAALPPVLTCAGAAQALKNEGLKVGMVLNSIQGRPVRTLPYGDVMRILKEEKNKAVTETSRFVEVDLRLGFLELPTATELKVFKYPAGIATIGLKLAFAEGAPPPTHYDAFGDTGPFLWSLNGKRQSFPGERPQKLQTHRVSGAAAVRGRRDALRPAGSGLADQALDLDASSYDPRPIKVNDSSHLTSPHLTSPHLTSPHLTSPHLTSPHLTSPHHLIPSHLIISPHITSPIKVKLVSSLMSSHLIM